MGLGRLEGIKCAGNNSGCRGSFTGPPPRVGVSMSGLGLFVCVHGGFLWGFLWGSPLWVSSCPRKSLRLPTHSLVPFPRFLFPGSFSPSRGVPWGGYHSYLASDKSDRNDYLASDKSGMDGARERVGRGLEGKTCFGSTSLLELRRGEGCR